jgi:hypothetical protein
MSTVPLKYVSEAKLIELRGSVEANLDRYTSGGFLDLEPDNGWAIESLSVRVNMDVLGGLDHSAGDIVNSLVVHSALEGMTPALAAEERVWVRLTHIECLEYTRARWLANQSAQGLAKAIHKHVFAPGRTGTRDDNAVSRLWWNVYIASLADPNDPEGALHLLLKTADIRQGFVERPGTAARRPLARGILRAMRRDQWIMSRESHFREFMKVLNRDGGGVLFEALTDEEVDQMMNRCAERARAHVGD